MVTSCNPFVESGVGHMEFKVCEFLQKTPMELGDIRRKDPLGVAFIERHIVWEYEQKEKQYKEMERKSKQKKGRHR